MRTLNIAHDFTNTYTQILPTCNNLFFHWYSRRIDIEYICRAYVLYSKYALTSRVVAKRCRDYQYPVCRNVDERTPGKAVSRSTSSARLFLLRTFVRFGKNRRLNRRGRRRTIIEEENVAVLEKRRGR